MKARVFVDTCAVKHSIRHRAVMKKQSLGMQTWGGKPFEAFICQPADEDPTANIHDEPLRTEIDLLSKVADLARRKEIELLWHNESRLEFWGIHLMPGGGSSELLDAGFTTVSGPIEYSRVVTPIVPFSESWRETQIRFFKSLQHARFLELQKACGAYQGKGRINEKQLIDAFHVWCAEEAGATHFLTTDLKLVRIVRQRKKSPPRVRVVPPSELLADLAAVVPLAGG